MKALKLGLYQETVCYKKPYAFKVTETYPLPPYSTVIGFLHNVINATEYNPMRMEYLQHIIQQDFIIKMMQHLCR